MSRRRGSATALNASDVVAALAMLTIYSYIGICQALSSLAGNREACGLAGRHGRHPSSPAFAQKKPETVAAPAPLALDDGAAAWGDCRGRRHSRQGHREQNHQLVQSSEGDADCPAVQDAR